MAAVKWRVPVHNGRGTRTAHAYGNDGWARDSLCGRPAPYIADAPHEHSKRCASCVRIAAAQ